MSFSDDDLKRFKEIASNPQSGMSTVINERLCALLARLEAAEKVAEMAILGHYGECAKVFSSGDEYAECDCESGKRWDAWLVSKGGRSEG